MRSQRIPRVSFLKHFIRTGGLLQSPMLLPHWSACLTKFTKWGKNVVMMSFTFEARPSTFYKVRSLRSSLKLRRCHSEDACTCQQDNSKILAISPCYRVDEDILGSGLSGTMNATRFRHLAPAARCMLMHRGTQPCGSNPWTVHDLDESHIVQVRCIQQRVACTAQARATDANTGNFC